MKWLPLTALLLFPCAAGAQQIPPCNLAGGANYSGTVGTGSTALIPPNPNSPGVRTGIFIQCLTASCVLGINASNQAASTTAAGNLVLNGQYQYFNAASLGFVPQGPINVIANANSTVVTAFACPQ